MQSQPGLLMYTLILIGDCSVASRSYLVGAEMTTNFPGVEEAIAAGVTPDLSDSSLSVVFDETHLFVPKPCM
jgi:hypothetical protein